MSRTLYLMRHAQTLFNVLSLYQCSCDSPLIEDGVKQSRQVGEKLRDLGLDFDHFYSSTSERACDTLEYVMQGRYGEVRPYVRLKGLKEYDRGVLEGLPNYVIPRHKPYSDQYFKDMGGETDGESLERVRSTLADIMSRSDHENVLAVTHGGVGALFMKDVAGEETFERVGMVNCLIAVFDFEPGEAPGEGTFTYKDAITPPGPPGSPVL